MIKPTFRAFLAAAAALLFCTPPAAMASVNLAAPTGNADTITCPSTTICPRNTPVDDGGTTMTETTNHSLKVTIQPGTSVTGDVGQAAQVPGACLSNGSATMANPASGTTYAGPATALVLGDLVSNSATAGSTNPWVCTVSRANDKPFVITEAKLWTSNTTITNGTFRIHFYRAAAPVVSNGDDGALLTTSASEEFCVIEVVLNTVHTNGAYGKGAPLDSNTCTSAPASGTQTIWAEIEARAAYARLTGQTWSLWVPTLN